MTKKEALTFVVFGGTGDLAKKKLAPAFSQLIHKRELKNGSTLIGISRKKLSNKDYKSLLMKSVSNKKEKKHLEEINIRHLSIDFSKEKEIKKLAQALPYCEIDGCNRIYYLATSYKLFGNIVRGLAKNNLLTKKHMFNRIVFEKPFGADLKTSDKLGKDICRFVDEKQIYRIDHYLGKESVENISKLKFTNNKFWNKMNNHNVESIDVVVSERLGVGNRMEYYNDFGAIKDMIQNHLLQVLSIILMEKPKKINTENIRNEKVKILKKLKVLDYKNHLLGQYNSYAEELKKNKIKKSKTETFAKINLECNNKRWKGVKINLITGKKLPIRKGKVIIRFKNKESIDKIVINLQPEQDIKIHTKKKTIKNMGWCPECKFSPNSQKAYANLLQDIIEDDKTLFIRGDEIHESWKIVDKIEKMKNKIKFVIYRDYTNPEKLV